MEEDITIFARTNFRNQKVRFGIKTDDRRRHIYTVGKTGMGKTVMLENMVIQDIQKGHGVAVVDPHGEFAEKMLDFVPSHRVNDVIYINPADMSQPIAFNILEKVDPEYRHLIASGLMGVFKKIWPDVWSARMEYLLNNAFLALLEYPGSTLLGVNRIFADKDYRKKVVDRLTDPAVKSFWVNEFAKYPDRFREEAVAPIQNKVGQFISVPLVRNIVGQTKSSIDMRKIMDGGKILIVNLSKGKLGEDNSQLLGAMLITKLQLAAMSRVDIPEEERRDYYLYVDEFQNFATESFANILSEARKYRLCLTMAHQYIAQLDSMTEKGKSTKVRDAVFGNVGTMIMFRVGAEDAEFLERELTPEFTAQDLVNLNKYNIYLKLMIDGVASRAFSAETLSPFPKPGIFHREKIIKVSQERYGTPRQKVEEKIAKWSGIVAAELEEKAVATGQGLYDAVCEECGKATKVIFEPDGKRPVYCKTCLKKIKGEKGRSGSGEINQRKEQPKLRGEKEVETNKEEVSTISLQEAIEREQVYFTRPKKEKSSEEELPKKHRKPVDLDDLRKTLDEALDKAKGYEDSEPLNEARGKQSSDRENEPSSHQAVEQSSEKEETEKPRETNNNSSGVLKPGESVRF